MKALVRPVVNMFCPTCRRHFDSAYPETVVCPRCGIKLVRGNLTPEERAKSIVESVLRLVEKWVRIPILFGGPLVERDSGATSEPQEVLAELVAQQLRAAIAEERERCAATVPTTWLDPLLTGDRKALQGNGPWHEADIERLLRAIAAAIRGRT